MEALSFKLDAVTMLEQFLSFLVGNSASMLLTMSHLLRKNRKLDSYENEF